MRDKSRKEGWDHAPPSNLSSDGVDAWYMMQRQRQQELKERRKEAAEILRGYRAPYQDDQSIEWGTSPRSSRRARVSFGDANLNESLTDPSSPAANKRRQSAMPRMQSDWEQREDMDHGTVDRFDFHEGRNQFPSSRTDFLREQPHYSNEQYDRSVFENPRTLFPDDPNFLSPEQRGSFHLNGEQNIDTSASQSRLRDAEEKRRSAMHNPSNEPEPSVPETVWRDFVSPGECSRFSSSSSYGKVPI